MFANVLPILVAGAILLVLFLLGYFLRDHSYRLLRISMFISWPLSLFLYLYYGFVEHAWSPTENISWASAVAFTVSYLFYKFALRVEWYLFDRGLLTNEPPSLRLQGMDFVGLFLSWCLMIDEVLHIFFHFK